MKSKERISKCFSDDGWKFLVRDIRKKNEF